MHDGGFKPICTQDNSAKQEENDGRNRLHTNLLAQECE